ncbi:hypothetical protein PCASD_02174 [Puccinia coronata f. sp. avenae]|uniref:Uncharacterized protein n=1 Tax=Puccinia coronata f. sp. avenae TaxID=200324 RepID=A0A2N5VI91_9BASI|nr:hypothetical protein PCASD_02174 [Puccinia coronata f. sp. avenae]
MAARAVLEQPCSTGGRTDTVRPKREPTGRTDLCFGRTVPVRPPVEHGCSSTAQTAVFDRLMPAVSEFIFHMELRRPSSDLSTRTTTSLE